MVLLLSMTVPERRVTFTKVIHRYAWLQTQMLETHGESIVDHKVLAR